MKRIGVVPALLISKAVVLALMVAALILADTVISCVTFTAIIVLYAWVVRHNVRQM